MLSILSSYAAFNYEAGLKTILMKGGIREAREVGLNLIPHFSRP